MIALPDSVITIAAGRVHRPRRLTGSIIFVERPELTRENPHGPSIGNDVVRRQRQNMLVVAQTEQANSQVSASSQSKWPLRFGANQTACFGLAPRFGKRAQINARERSILGRGGNLTWASIDLEELHAQRFMAALNLIQARLQRAHTQPPTDANGPAEIVKRDLRFQLLHKP